MIQPYIFVPGLAKCRTMSFLNEESSILHLSCIKTYIHRHIPEFKPFFKYNLASGWINSCCNIYGFTAWYSIN